MGRDERDVVDGGGGIDGHETLREKGFNTREEGDC